jgi:peptidoglycan hydrolase CwlO-like protein
MSIRFWNDFQEFKAKAQAEVNDLAGRIVDLKADNENLRKRVHKMSIELGIVKKKVGVK